MSKYNLDYLLKQNEQYADRFRNSPIMQLIVSAKVDNAKSRQLLLDCIQVFSNYFQKTVMLRLILSDDDRFIKIAREHLSEEFGHDVSLMHDRNDRKSAWDPILDACSAWFTWKMFTLDNAAKTLLVHLVLEVSANIFFIEANQVMLKYKETDYFKIHAEVDEHHAQMGVKLLAGLSCEEYRSLNEVQKQGWDMLNSVCNRITEIIYAK